MRIDPPPGYEHITPLRKDYRVRLPRAEQTPAIFQRLHLMPMTLSEFEPACRDYPLAFVTSDAGNTFSPVLVLGLQPGQNLFILADGSWDRRTYLPTYVRRYPFCMGAYPTREKSGDARIICIEESALQDSGGRLYDEQGHALSQWLELERLIFDYEQDRSRCRSLCGLAVELGLLEPFTMKAEVDGFTMQLEGMHRVSPAALEMLPAQQLQRLMSAGALVKIYSHLHSLDNLTRLLNRRSFFAITDNPANFN